MIVPGCLEVTETLDTPEVLAKGRVRPCWRLVIPAGGRGSLRPRSRGTTG